jgi:hypothetical protein
MLAAAGIGAAPTAGAATQPPLQEFRGTVAGIDREHRALVLHRADGRRLRVTIPPRIQFAACRWGGLRVGWHLDVHARHTGGRWIAARVERRHDGHYSHDRWGDDGWHDGHPAHAGDPGHEGAPVPDDGHHHG